MSQVFVVDANKQPLNPVHAGHARLLLSSGQAAVFKRYPFTIILKMASSHPEVHPLRIKVDPGSKTTGLALIMQRAKWCLELRYSTVDRLSRKRWIGGGACDEADAREKRGTESLVS